MGRGANEARDIVLLLFCAPGKCSGVSIYSNYIVSGNPSRLCGVRRVGVYVTYRHECVYLCVVCVRGGRRRGRDECRVHKGQRYL